MMDGKQVKPLDLRNKIGYLFGNFGNDFTLIFASTLLIVFHMKVLRTSGAVAGTLSLVARVVDAFRDITMGRIMDMYRPGKDGRFRQWIRRMTGPMAIASFLMYQSSLAGAPITARIVYMYVTYLLWGSIYYTVINIPCGSMTSAITDKPDERIGLPTFRGIGANLVQLIIGILGPVIIYAMNENEAQVIRNNDHIFPIVAVTFSLCAIARYVICYKYTTEWMKIDEDSDTSKITLAKIFKTIFSSRAMLEIIGAALFLMLSQLLISDLNNYLYMDYFGDTKAFSSYAFINIMLSLILAALVGSITRCMGKKEAAVAATAFTSTVYLVPFFLELTNSWVYMISAAIGFLGVSFFNLMIWANITDAIGDAEVMTGEREDGTIYSVYFFTRKVGQALAGGLSGYVLEMIEYQSADKVQSLQVLNGLYTISTLIPALLFFCMTIMLLVVYPLNKKKAEENSLVLRECRAGK